MKTYTFEVRVNDSVPGAVTPDAVIERLRDMRGVTRVVRGEDRPVRPTATELRRLKTAVIDATEGRPSLTAFLHRLHGLHPDLDAAIEGVYCGAEGRVTAEIGDWGRMLCFGWTTTEGRKAVVEWAYIS